MHRWIKSRLLLVSVAAAWALAATGSAALAAGQAPVWAVEAGSRIAFSASMSGAGFSGTFARWTAQIRFDPANLPGSSAKVQIATASARTGDASRDEALPTGDWFATRSFPTASFQSDRIRALGGGRYVADGKLTIRNVARPVSLPFALTITGNRALMRGSLTIDRGLFGVGQGQFADDSTVSRAVRIDINLAARKLP